MKKGFLVILLAIVLVAEIHPAAAEEGISRKIGEEFCFKIGDVFIEKWKLDEEILFDGQTLAFNFARARSGSHELDIKEVLLGDEGKFSGSCPADYLIIVCKHASPQQNLYIPTEKNSQVFLC
jgi:hypothetical protein